MTSKNSLLLTTLNQFVLQDIKFLWESQYGCKNMYGILSDTLWNSTTVIALTCINNSSQTAKLGINGLPQILVWTHSHFFSEFCHLECPIQNKVSVIRNHWTSLSLCHTKICFSTKFSLKKLKNISFCNCYSSSSLNITFFSSFPPF